MAPEMGRAPPSALLRMSVLFPRLTSVSHPCYGLPMNINEISPTSEFVCVYCEEYVLADACYRCNEYKGVMTIEEWEAYTGYMWED
jgi:hypothetical protein